MSKNDEISANDSSETKDDIQDAEVIEDNNQENDKDFPDDEEEYSVDDQVALRSCSCTSTYFDLTPKS